MPYYFNVFLEYFASLLKTENQERSENGWTDFCIQPDGAGKELQRRKAQTAKSQMR